jgi:hypothetical protein
LTQAAVTSRIEIHQLSIYLSIGSKRWEWHANETRFWRCNRWRPTPKNTIFLFAFFLLQANYRIRRWSQPPFANHWMSAVRVGGNCGLGFLNDLSRGGVYISYPPPPNSLTCYYTHGGEMTRVYLYMFQPKVGRWAICRRFTKYKTNKPKFSMHFSKKERKKAHPFSLFFPFRV